MDKQHREAILTDCIEQLQAGATVAACLARHGAEGAAVAPLLGAAARLQRVNRFHLADDQRRQAKAALLAAMLSRRGRPFQPMKASPRRFRPVLLGSSRGLALAGTLALALCLVISITAVAASQPGDLAYPVRVLAERAPVLLKTTAATKTTTELRIADRRLADLETHLSAQGKLAPAAVAALLAGDQAAASRADALSPAERARAASKVAAHAATLVALAQSAPQPAARDTLQAAATQVERLAEILMPGAATEDTKAPAIPEPTAAPVTPTTQDPSSSSGATHTPPDSGVLAVTPTPASPQATRSDETLTAQPFAPGHRATALAQTATASPSGSATAAPANRTPMLGTPGSGPDMTPIPGRRATALAQTPPAPTPSATLTVALRPDTPAPGRRATSLAQTATAPAPAATDTPPTPAPGRVPDTPVPGRRATAQAQTAMPAGVTDTPSPPGLAPTREPGTPVPGRRATARAQDTPPAGATDAPVRG